MQRNMDLIRKLLFFYDEKSCPGIIEDNDIVIEGHEENEIAYHNRLLYDAGFLRCESVRSSSSQDRVIRVLPFELTWEGHEFLDKIRSETTWRNIVNYSKNKGLVLSFNLVNELAKKSIAAAVFGA